METKHISINRGILIEKSWSGRQLEGDFTKLLNTLQAGGMVLDDKAMDALADYAVNWLDSDAVSSGGFIETYRFRSSSKILVITLDSRLQVDGDYFRELIEVIAEKLNLEVNSTDLVRQVREAFYKI